MKPALLLSLVLIVGSVAAVSPKRVNPFSRPEVVEPAQDAAVARPQQQLVLRGVLAAGSRSMANLNGQIIAIGEEAYGYRLDSVQENTARFTKEGEVVVMTVAPLRESEP